VPIEKQLEPTEEWLTYSDTTYGYSVEYPKGWNVKELVPYQGVTQRIQHELLLDGPRGTIKITTWTNYTSLDLIDWLKEREPPLIRPVSLVPSAANVRIAGEPAVFVVLPKPLGGYPRLTTILQRGQVVFRILYLEPVEEIEKLNFDLYKHILSTFEFEDTKDIPDILPSKPE